MKTAVGIRMIDHLGEVRIALDLPEDPACYKLVRLLTDSKWSQSKRCWHIPFNRSSYKELKSAFQNHSILEGFDVSSLRDTLSDGPSLESLETTFGKKEDNHWSTLAVNKGYTEGVAIFCPRANGRLYINLPDDPAMREKMDSMPYRKFHAAENAWSIPLAEPLIHSLTQFLERHQFRIEYRKEQPNKKGPIKQLTDKVCPSAYVDQLVALHYSENTLKTYQHLFSEFAFYCDQNKIVLERIDTFHVFQYLKHLKERGVSESYQNQTINALKIYTDHILRNFEIFKVIKRPAKPKREQELLSDSEINLLFQEIRNKKHEILLLLILENGVRLKDLLKIMVSDFNPDKNEIIIQQSTTKVKQKIKLNAGLASLMKSYLRKLPSDGFLFSGQFGGAYSARSCQVVFKNALRNAGIEKEVSLLSLRNVWLKKQREGG
jgi:site-specific recombinase XerD